MTSLDQVRRTLESLEKEIARVMVGQEPVVDGVLTAVFTGGHALLEGVPGLGKTLLARTVAAALGLPTSRIQFTPDLMPADIVGTQVVDEVDGRRSFRFERGPIFASLVLADEINRATPKTQSALLEAMQEQQVTAGGTTHALPSPFCVLATQNPLEMEGTFPLPEAQLDRFMLHVLVPFPSLSALGRIMERTTGTGTAEVRRVLDGGEVVAIRDALRAVPAAPPVVDYALRIVLGTHPESEHATAAAKELVRVGASPRAAQAMLLAGKYRAVKQGRENVAFEDVRAVAPSALRHRLTLSFEGEASGTTPDAVVTRVLADVPELAAPLERESARRA